MLQTDLNALESMMEEFEDLANSSEAEFALKCTPELKVSHYKTVCAVVSRGCTKDILFLHFQTMLTNYLLRYSNLESLNEEDQYNAACAAWTHYKKLLKWNVSSFNYFSRLYRKNLNDVGVTIFLERIWKPCHSAVYTVCLRLFEAQHMENENLLVALEIAAKSLTNGYDYPYEQQLVKPYIQQTITGMINCFNIMSASGMTPDELFSKLQELLSTEVSRCLTYFSCPYADQVLQAVKKSLQNTTSTLLLSADGLLKKFEENNEAALKAYYEFFFSQSDPKAFSNAFQQCIETCGVHASETHNVLEARQYALNIINLYSKCAVVVNECFNKEKSTLLAVQNGIESVFQMKVKVVGGYSLSFWECFVRLIDFVMRDNQVNCVMPNLEVMSLLHDESDVLNCLAESMLLRVLYPNDKFHVSVERELIVRLSQALKKKVPQLDRIIEDLDISNSFMKSEAVRRINSSDVIRLFALRRSTWVARRVTGPQLNLPANILSQLEAVGNEYTSDMENRTIQWCHYASSAVLVSLFKGSSAQTTLFVSAPQALVLLSFNEGPSVSIRLLCSEYNFTVDSLKEAVTSLLAAAIVKKEASASIHQISEDDVLLLNDSYTPEAASIRLWRGGSEQLNIAKNESTVAVQMRADAVDASIVTSVKKGPQSYEKLLESCHERVPYSVPTAFVKARLEELIRRGHISRDPTNSSLYSYVA